MNRRELIMNSLKTIMTSFFVFKSLDTVAKESPAKEAVIPQLKLKKSDFVDLNDQVAKSLKLTDDFSKSAEAQENKCLTCRYFNQKGVYENKKVGTCIVFQDKYVTENSHCISWLAKS